MNLSFTKLPRVGGLTDTRVWACLALGAIPLWVYGLTSSELSISDLGIIDSFPIVFWIALGLILLSYVGLTLSPRPPEACLAVLLTIVIASFWLFPLLLGASQPVAAHIWAKNGGNIAPLFASGELDPEHIWYHSWPAVWLIVVFLRHIMGVSSVNETETLLPFVPFVIQLTLSLLMYVLLRSLWSKETKFIWLSLLVFVLANWSVQIYLSPQAYGLALFILFLFVTMRQQRTGQESRDPGAALMLLILVAGVTIGHLPSAMFMVATLTGLYLMSRTPWFARFPIAVISPVTAFVILVAWQFEWALPWTAANMHVLKSAFDLELQFKSGVSERFTAGTEAHAFVAFIRILYTALWGIVAFGGAVLALRDTRPATRPAVIVLATAALSLLAVNLAVGGQMNEIVERVHLFMLVPIAFFAAYLARHRATNLLLAAIVLAGLPLCFIALHGNQKADYLPPDYARAVEFFHASTDGGTVATRGPFAVPFGAFDPSGAYRVESFESMERAVSDSASGLMEGDDYVILTDSDRRRTEFVGQEQLSFTYLSDEVEASNLYGLVYSSPSVKIYAKLH
jgi:hypothetical protein